MIPEGGTIMFSGSSYKFSERGVRPPNHALETELKLFRLQDSSTKPVAAAAAINIWMALAISTSEPLRVHT
jgi:hypothetical protein